MRPSSSPPTVASLSLFSLRRCRGRPRRPRCFAAPVVSASRCRLLPHRRVAPSTATIASPRRPTPAPFTSRPRLSTSTSAPSPSLSHRDLTPASCCRPATAVRRRVSCRLGGPPMSSCPRRFGLASSSVVGRLRCWSLFGSRCRRWSVSSAGRFSLPVARRVVAAGSVSLVVSWIASGVLSINWWSVVELRVRVLVVSIVGQPRRARSSLQLAGCLSSPSTLVVFRRLWLLVVTRLSSVPVHRLASPVSCAALRGFHPLSYP